MSEPVILLKVDTSELPIFCPEMRAIPVIRKIIERLRPIEGDHDGRKKKHNVKELAFIHFYTHFQLKEKVPNPYWKYEPEVKFEKLKRDLEFPEKWTIDEDLQKAIDFYKETVVTSLEMDMLDAAEHAARQTITLLKGTDYSIRDTRGAFLYDAQKVMKWIQEVSGTIDGIQNLRERLTNSQKLSNEKIRGGGMVGSREVPKNVQ